MANQNKLIIALTLSATLSAKNCLANTDKAENSRMTKKAHQYFDDQLNLITNAAEAEEVITDKLSNVKIIDVRAERYFQVRRIAGSINIPYI